VVKYFKVIVFWFFFGLYFYFCQNDKPSKYIAALWVWSVYSHLMWVICWPNLIL